MPGKVSLISQNWIEERADIAARRYTLHVTITDLSRPLWEKEDRIRSTNYSYAETLCDMNAEERGGRGTIPYKLPLKYFFVDPGDVKLCPKCCARLDKIDGAKATKAIQLWLAMHRLGVTPTTGPRIKVYS